MNEPYVTLEDAAKHFSVSISTLRKWWQNGYIPEESYIRIDNVLRFKVSGVAAALVRVNIEESKTDLGMDTTLPKKESIQPDFFEPLDEDI